MTLSKGLALSVIVTLFGGLGCVKQRPTEYSQGQGIDAQAVGSLENRRDALDTKDEITGTTKTYATAGTTLSDDLADTMNRYPLVEYTTNSELLGKDLPLRGKAHAHYEVRYELTDGMFRVLKVGKKEELPIEEWPFAVNLSDGKMGIPMVGYPVHYFRVENAVNEDDVQTSRLTEIPVPDRAHATHYRIDRTARTIFQAIEKIDIFPAAYFKGQWFYQETVTDVHAGEERNLGMMSAFDSTFNAASRIRIDFSSKKSLMGINLNRDERISQDDLLNQNYAFTIPVEWKDYRAERVGQGPGMKEEENKDSEETKRPYVGIRFDQIVSAGNEESAVLDALTKVAGELRGLQQLVDLKFSRNYFSFTVLRGNTGKKVRYSLLRIDPAKPLAPARPFNEKDSRTFGYFVTQKNFEWDSQIQRKSDLEARSMMSRFNPEHGEIVYHFSHGTPRADQPYGWVRDVARQAVDFWDQAFKLAGTNIHIRLDESEDVDLGDLRYNIINITNPLLARGLLGYGPSLSDTRNGDTISATTNIQMTGFVEDLSSQIRRYMRSQLGLTNGNLTDTSFAPAPSNAQGLLGSLAPGAGLISVNVDKDGHVSREPLDLMSFADPQIAGQVQDNFTSLYTNPLTKGLLERATGQPLQNATDAVLRFRNLANAGQTPKLLSPIMNASTFLSGTNEFLVRRIQNLCPEIASFITKVHANGDRLVTSEETPVIEGCVAKVIRLPLMWTTLHEMGHNFSLRHNFTCSNDTSNFMTAQEVQKLYKGLGGTPFPAEYLPFNEDPPSSCVMDYFPVDGKTMPVPGKYDIAAIRFIYTNRVESADGNLLPVEKTVNGQPTFTPISELDVPPDHGPRHFKFCTDEDTAYSNEPMCAPFDIGLTPEQVVDAQIAAYWDSLANDNYRYGHQFRSPLQALNVIGYRIEILVKLKRFYDQWRFHVAEFVGQKDEYLERYTPDAYAKMLTQMSTSNLAKEYADYKPVRDKIAAFFAKVAYLPNRYCMGTTKSGQLTAVEFSKLQSELALVQKDAFAADCNAAGIQALLAKRQVKFIAELGHNLEATRYSTAVEDLKEMVDTYGTQMDRAVALAMTTARMESSQLHMARSFFPNLMDEPDLRAGVLKQYLNRAFQGVDLAEELSQIPALAKRPDLKKPLLTFSAETKLITAFNRTIRQGLMIPGKTEINQERAGLFATDMTREGTDQWNALQKLPQPPAILQLATGNVLFALVSNQISYNVIQQIHGAQSERTLASAPLNQSEADTVFGEMSKLLPEDFQTKFSALSFMKFLMTGQQLLQNDKISKGTRLVLSQVLQPYSQTLMKTNLPQVMQQVQTKAEAGQQAAQQLAAAGVPETAPVPPAPPEAKEIQDLRAVVAAASEAQSQMETALDSVDMGAMLAKNKSLGKLAIYKKSFITYANAVVTKIQALQEFDPQELDAHVDLLMGLL